MAAEKEVKAAEKPRATPKLMPARFGLAEQLRNDWVANVEFGTTIEDIQEPEFWSFLAPQMRPFDHIEARAEDGSWMAKLIVLGTDRNWARVKLLHEYKLTTSDVSMTQAMKHEVLWKGPHLKYSVIRLSDQEAVKTGFDKKDDAQRWMIDHEKMA